MFQRFVEQAVFWIFDNEARQLRQRFLDERSRQHDAAIDAGFHISDRLVGPASKPVDARQEIIVVLYARERLYALSRAQPPEFDRRRRELTDRQQFVAKL